MRPDILPLKNISWWPTLIFCARECLQCPVLLRAKSVVPWNSISEHVVVVESSVQYCPVVARLYQTNPHHPHHPHHGLDGDPYRAHGGRGRSLGGARRAGGDGQTDPLHGNLGLLLGLSQLPDTFTAASKSVRPVWQHRSDNLSYFQFLSAISSSGSASSVWTTPWEWRLELTSLATTLPRGMEPHQHPPIMLQLHLIMPQLHPIMHQLHPTMHQHPLHLIMLHPRPTTPTHPAALWLFQTPERISHLRRMIRFDE